MAQAFQMKEIGRGRYTSKNAAQTPPGACADSLNFLHTRDLDTARLRNALDRVFATRPAGAAGVLGAWEYVKSDGTKILLAKIASSLYTFTLGQTGALTSILSGMDGTHLPQFANCNGFGFIADWQAKNYVTDGTAANTYELQSASLAGVMSFADSGAAGAVGNPAGTIAYQYTRLNPTTGEESPPSGNVSTMARLADHGATLTNTSLSFAAPYTQVNVYRYSPGSTQYYLVTTGLTAGSFPYTDNSLDSSLTTAASAAPTLIFTTAGAAAIEKPEAAKHCVFYRGRLVLGNLSGKRSRIRWSVAGQPTQFSNSSASRLDIGLNDGGEITGLVVFRGALVIFKTASIWVMNGDVDETNFVVAPLVPGKGCVAARTIVADGDRRILFLSECGVLSFDMQTVPEVPLSDPIRDDVVAFDFGNRADFFCAGLDVCNHQYLLSVTPVGGSTNTKTHMLNLNTGAWGRMDFAMGQIIPSCYSSTGDSSTAPIHDATAGRAKLFIGAEHRYLYEWDTSKGADGVASGTKTATVTSATGGTTTAAAAAFRTTGDGLTGLGLTVRRAVDASYETVAITSNTATVISHGGWSGTQPVAGDTIFVGAYQGTLAYNRADLESGHTKHWHRLEVSVQKQTHTVPLRVGYTLDGGTAPTTTAEFDTSVRWATRLPVHRRATHFAPYLDIIGTDHATEVLLIDLTYDILRSRLPT